MPTSSTRSRGKDNPQTVLGVYRAFDTSLGADRPRRRAALDRRPGAARSRQSRHHPAHRRRGRRRRPDPGRRLRRPLLGRGGARLDGRAVHPEDRGGALGRVRRLAARRRGPAGRHQPRAELDYQPPRYEPPAFLLVGNEAHGLPEAYEAECDLLVKMPMLGKADSLNAAVATAVMAYEVINQWRPRPEPSPAGAARTCAAGSATSEWPGPSVELRYRIRLTNGGDSDGHGTSDSLIDSRRQYEHFQRHHAEMARLPDGSVRGRLRLSGGDRRRRRKSIGRSARSPAGR